LIGSDHIGQSAKRHDGRIFTLREHAGCRGVSLHVGPRLSSLGARPGWLSVAT